MYPVGSEPVEQLEDGGVALEERAVARHVAPAVMIRAGAFEPAAVDGAVVVDRAAVVVAQEDASAVAVGEDLLDDGDPIARDAGVDREGRELPLLVPFKEDRVIVPVLLAAGGDARGARAGANDGDTEPADTTTSENPRSWRLRRGGST